MITDLLLHKNHAVTVDIKNGSPRRENICAIVVTYQPDGGFASRVDHLAGQVDLIVIVDNHSGDTSVAMLDLLLANRVNLHLIRNSDNLGVATALNQGVRWAKEAGYRWALLLDQDTTLLEFTVEILIAAYRGFPGKSRLAVIGANYLGTIQECETSNMSDFTNSWKECVAVITSGSLLSIAGHEAIGPFRDDLFIDHVDHEYCLRARSKGWKIIMSRQLAIQHVVGVPMMHWPSLKVLNHSPYRHYYMARNSVVIARQYFTKEPSWILAALAREAKAIFLMLLFERDRKAKLMQASRGLWHGFLGRLGKIEMA
jgi:rhamnosyltransferase